MSLEIECLWTVVKFCFLPKSKGKNIVKNLKQNSNCKYSQKCLDHTKQSVAKAFKITSKREDKKKQKY